jgi:hypothetical protein
VDAVEGVFLTERVFVHSSDSQVKAALRGLGVVEPGDGGTDPISSDPRVENVSPCLTTGGTR